MKNEISDRQLRKVLRDPVPTMKEIGSFLFLVIAWLILSGIGPVFGAVGYLYYWVLTQ